MIIVDKVLAAVGKFEFLVVLTRILKPSPSHESFFYLMRLPLMLLFFIDFSPLDMA